MIDANLTGAGIGMLVPGAINFITSCEFLQNILCLSFDALPIYYFHMSTFATILKDALFHEKDAWLPKNRPANTRVVRNRKKLVTASKASTIIAQGKGHARIFEQKVGMRDTNISSEYMTIGPDNEPTVVALYREKFPEEGVFHDLSIIPNQTLDYVAASLDACTASGITVQIKTVFEEKFVKVSRMYCDQVQLQMEVADLEKTHLVQHYIRMPDQSIVVREIVRHRGWFERNCGTFKGIR